MPATAYIEMALAASQEIFGESSHEIEDVVIHQALILPEEGYATVQLVLSPENDGRADFKIICIDPAEIGAQNSWRLHASGYIGAGKVKDKAAERAYDTLGEIESRCTEEISTEAFYSGLRRCGIALGPRFHSVEKIRHNRREALADFRAPEQALAEMDDYHIYPALLDACLQIFDAIRPEDGQSDRYLPLSLKSFRRHRRPSPRMRAYAVLRESAGSESETFSGDARLFDEEGSLVAEIEGLVFKRTSVEAFRRAIDQESADYLYETMWLPQGARQPGDSVTTEPEAPGTWVIFEDRHGVGSELSRALARRNHRCVLVTAGDGYEASGEGAFKLAPDRPEDFKRLFEEVFKDPASCLGVVYLWALDASVGENLGADSLEAVQRVVCGGALHAAQTLVNAVGSGLRGLWLVTRGAMTAGSEAVDPSIAQAPLWGIGRTIAQEHPELHCMLVDLESGVTEKDAQTVLNEIGAQDSENQVAYRGNIRHVARLLKAHSAEKKSAPVLTDSALRPVRLDNATPGILDGLAFRPVLRQAPGAGEVEIRVHAVGLNFRDVLNALGMYPGEAVQLGVDCAGMITALGEGVEEFNVGDAVFGIAPGCFGTFVNTHSKLVIRKPPEFGFEGAAAIPSVFLTVYYSLHRLAKISAGERILIHSATGGVGLAALQLAQQAGAEIFATVGSPEKTAFLKTLGVEHIMNSRSLDFFDEVMEKTAGQGVDIVLNALTGEFIPKGLALLRADGRFLELGKREILDSGQIAGLKKGIQYLVVDLAEKFKHDQAAVRSMLSEISDRFRQGTLNPLPIRVFRHDETVEAFRFMAQAKHIGKIVVSQEVVDQQGAVGTDDRRKSAADDPAVVVKKDASYLITGGLGGLGLRVAQWMAERGVRHLVLMGRSEASADAREKVERLKRKGVEVILARGDVAKLEDVARVFDRIAETLPLLHGIVHCAGALDDGGILQQNWHRFANVMAPKVTGTWHLHRLSQSLPLDFFVLFSSIASLLGSVGQANYAAACAFQDAMAHYRRRRGLPATSINWGSWSEAGMAARGGVDTRLKSQGVSPFTPESGVRALQQIMDAGFTQVAAVRFNWSQFMRCFYTDRVPPRFFDHFAKAGRGAANEHEKRKRRGEDLLKLLQEAPPGRRKKILMNHIAGQAAQVLGIVSWSSEDYRKPLRDGGLDSLMAVELRNRLGSTLSRRLPATLLFDCPTVEAVTDYLAGEMGSLFEPTDAPPASSGEVRPEESIVGAIEQLSEDEVERLYREWSEREE